MHLWFYLLIGVPFFGVAFLLWRPLPLTLSPPARIAALIVGALLYFPGLGLVLWGRLTLGQMYNVSTIADAQLYADHRLITHGPFAIVRHPMYLGLTLAALGGLLIYRTWTIVFTLTFLGLFVRARRRRRTRTGAGSPCLQMLLHVTQILRKNQGVSNPPLHFDN